MTDIVERLRAPVTVERHDGLLIEAADEIERLRIDLLREQIGRLRELSGEIERLRAGLQDAERALVAFKSVEIEE